ncbi:histidine phosphatase family protein [Robiginitalea sp.]|nr:histidine phosphatase family protein [Robiginitalea sp.]
MGVKEIILMRHGKSSWDYPVDDRDRPLLPRGIQDARRVAFVLRDMPMPDAVFSSPANRALHTCCIAMNTLGYSFEKLRVSEQLYDFDGKLVTSFVKQFNDDLHRVMLFGHNHAFTTLADAWGDTPLHHLPTAGAVRLQFDIRRWQDLSQGKTLQIISPKNL